MSNVSQILKSSCADLLSILSYGRPHNSKLEGRFITVWVDSLAEETGFLIEADMFGNRWLTVPPKAGETVPNILWSCHVDTMDSKGEMKGIRWIDERTLGLRDKKPGRCLGADDGAGLFLLREMILAGVPGTYVFHRGEEMGRLGSKHVRDKEPERLKGFDACIAFDRKGKADIITHQMGERGASEAFAKSFSRQLHIESFGVLDYEPDPTGSYTDSYTYFRYISECTNVSIGYRSEHGPNETLDVGHVWALRCAMVRLDLSKLVIERDCTVTEYDDDWGYGGSGTGWSAGLYGLGGSKPRTSTFGRVEGGYTYRTEPTDPTEALVDLCREYPDEAASFIASMGFSATDFLEHLAQEYGDDELANAQRMVTLG